MRTRLMLWNVGIVALVLTAMGGLISITVRAKLMASVERDLRDRAEHVGPPPGAFDGPPPGQNGGPDGRPGAGPDGRRRGGSDSTPAQGRGRGPDFRGGPPPGPRPPRRGWPGALAPQAPRMFNLDGTGRPPFQESAPWDRQAFELSAAGQEVVKTIDVDGEPALLISRPKRYRSPGPGGPGPDERGPGRPREAPAAGVVQAIYPLADVNRSVSEMNMTLLTLIPVGLILAGAGGAWLTDRALRPVRQITLTASRIGAEDLEQRLPLTGGDEFAELSGTINGMLARLQAAFGRMEALVEQQRRFSADASHELKTPLTVIKANSSLTLATEPDREGYREAVREIDCAADSMNRLVQDLLLLAQADEAQAGQNRTVVPAAELLARCAERGRRPGQASIRCRPVDGALTLCVNEEETARVLSNLIENALRHTPADGEIVLDASRDGDEVALTVSDTGVGIAEEHLAHLGERFYRVDASRSRQDGGSGLGLAICKSLVEANGGRMTIESEVGKGTLVKVTLPAGQEAIGNRH